MPRRLLAVLLAYRNSVVSTDRLVEVLWDGAARRRPPPPSRATCRGSAGSSSWRRRRHPGEPGARLRARGARRPRSTPAASSAGLAEGRTCSTRDPARRPRPRSTPRSASGGATPSPSSPRPSGSGPRRSGSRSCGWSRSRRASTPSCASAVTTRWSGELEALLVDHPLREQFTRQPMLALYRSGRQAEALRVAQQFRATLRDDLGLEPSADAARPREPRSSRSATTSRGCRRDAPGAPATRAAPRSRRAARSETHRARRARARPRARRRGCSRPAASSRCSDPAAWARPASRTGSPSTIADQFADGVRLVELAPVRDEGAVTAAVAAALDVQQRPNRIARRLDRRAARRRSRCCSCSTTASTCSTPPASWSSRCCSGAPTCRCSPPAASRSASPPRWCGRCRRCRCPRASTSRSTTLAEVPAVQLFVERAARRAGRLRARRRQPRAPSPSSASGSTACRSRSSSRRRACGR